MIDQVILETYNCKPVLRVKQKYIYLSRHKLVYFQKAIPQKGIIISFKYKYSWERKWIYSIKICYPYKVT